MLRSQIIFDLLRKRGIEDIEKYLNPSIHNLVAAERLPGIKTAAELIIESVRAGRHIVVFGDYDCDGVCATAIMTKAITAIGGKVEPFLPERLTEGYGMTDASVSRMLKYNPEVSVIVTVDNGVNAVNQVAELKARGITVIITDHHLPGPELPAADVCVNPKVAAPSELGEICGATVAYLLANQLVASAREHGFYQGENIGGPLLIMAGLATVTDVMPLLGQNRILVAEALAHFRSWAPIGLKELHSRAARTGYEHLTSRDFGFMLGPRINASGRLASGMAALELVTTDDREIARESARLVDLKNAERKSIEQHMTEVAISKIVPDAPAQVIDLPDGHPGVAGIVAARLLEHLHDRVPVCVISGGHGSARSPESINIRQAFEACAEFLNKFGGHAAAGGFSVIEGKVDAFRERLCEYCRPLVASADVVVTREPEVWITLDDITLELAEDILKMEPFGESNEEPVFGVRSVNFCEVRSLGADNRHLAATIANSQLRGVWWNHGSEVDRLRQTSHPFDVLLKIVVSEYGGRHAEFRLEDVRDSVDVEEVSR